MVFVAHVVTEDAHAPAPPEIAVTEFDEQTGVAEPLISYGLPLHARVADAVDLLQANGWSLYGTRRFMEPGYWVVQLEPNDWATIVKAVTYARQTAEIDRQCREAAWRTVVAGAMRDQGTVKTLIAEAAGVSRERAYQIRDGRR